MRSTPDRIDTPEYIAFTRRVLRAMAQRADQFEPEHLVQLVSLARLLNEVIGETVAACRKSGYTWEQIGTELGTSKQAAQQRWGRYENQ